MISREPTIERLAIAEGLLLAPFGLTEAHLAATLAAMGEHRIDDADLYFQTTRHEGWSLEEGIVKSGSFSIDQQRYNFQFGGQLFYEIENGKIVGMLKDVAYQANTQEFWNSCVAVADQRDYRLGGAFNDGKGQPAQSNAVSHGSATARFNGVNVINTARKI